MVRTTITLPEEHHKWLTEARARVLRETGHDISMSDTINFCVGWTRSLISSRDLKAREVFFIELKTYSEEIRKARNRR